MQMKEIKYGAPARQILAMPDHYVAIGVKHEQADSVTPGLAVLVNGRYVVKAGTIYPANDATAIGIIANDYDVTFGAQMLAVIIHGFIKTAAMPVVPSTNAIGALHQITFLPIGAMVVAAFNEALTTAALYAVGATAVTSKTVLVALEDGLTFSDAATTLANWTITGESVAKVTVASIALDDTKTVATITLATTATALVAGDITVKPLAAAVGIGKAVATAITIATVA